VARFFLDSGVLRQPLPAGRHETLAQARTLQDASKADLAPLSGSDTLPLQELSVVYPEFAQNILDSTATSTRLRSLIQIYLLKNQALCFNNKAVC
jgi:hypothetical protein